MLLQILVQLFSVLKTCRLSLFHSGKDNFQMKVPTVKQESQLFGF